MKQMQKIVVIGAGPVGSLAALYAARRGHQVEVYELRPDLRDPSTVPLNFTRSINLAVSERGINALRHAKPGLEDDILQGALPMRGRMIHGRRSSGVLYEDPQDYDVLKRCIYAADRGNLNKRLLDQLETMSNVEIFFNHKLNGVDFQKRKAWLEVRDRDSTTNPDHLSEREVSFDLLIGADGAHSVTRHHLMKFARMNYQQEYIDTLWCEFHMAAAAMPTTTTPDDKRPTRHRISSQHLHIWPAQEFMFIAIPNIDATFTCTLFLPDAQFKQLEADPESVPGFFDQHFPGVTTHIPPTELIGMFQSNPHLPLINVKCKPHHFGSSGVIVGDAAHAMVPFFGQGMNAGLEDVRILFATLDKHYQTVDDDDENMEHTKEVVEVVDRKAAYEHARAAALSEYTAMRVPDAHAINDLALNNYIEMRASVLSVRYRVRKFLEESLAKRFPGLGWQTKYSRVSFGNERYSLVVAKSELQGKWLARFGLGILSSPLAIVGLVMVAWKRRASDLLTRG